MLEIRGRKVIRSCDMCGMSSYMWLTYKELADFRDYLSYKKPIQLCFPQLNPCEREFLKSGYCPKCQRALFCNGKTKRVHICY